MQRNNSSDFIKSLQLHRLPFHSVAYVRLNLKSPAPFSSGAEDFFSFEFSKDPLATRPLIFDLASLTKPLMLSSLYLKSPELFDASLMALIEHRCGLISGGRLGKKDWRAQILSYPLGPWHAPCVYSDFSALRAQLELEKKGVDFHKHFEFLKSLAGDHFYHWQNIPLSILPVATGYRQGQEIRGQVHDDNAFNLKELTVHTGLFSSTHALARLIVALEEKYAMTSHIKTLIAQNPSQRFIAGFDRSLDPRTTLAGAGRSEFTFGHLGFTGTSFWIDAEKQIIQILLTNQTSFSWIDRKALTHLRRTLGEWGWKY